MKRDKLDTDALWELTKRVSGLETKIDAVLLHQRRTMKTRNYYLNQIKKLRVEKQGLRNYIKELEKFNKLPVGESNLREDL